MEGERKKIVREDRNVHGYTVVKKNCCEVHAG